MTMSSAKEQLPTFLHILNQEADVAAAAIPVLLGRQLEEWDAVLGEHPEWRRFGTFDALLDEARAELYKQPSRSQAIVEVVLRHRRALHFSEGAELLAPLLDGLTRKVYASSQNVQGQHEAALENIELSLQAFSGQPALEVERAAALLVRAQIQHALKRIPEALGAIQEAVAIFEAHYQYKRHEMALEICGHILLDQKSYLEAREVYQSAYETAERLYDDWALPRLDNALGLCAIYLHQPEEASFRLTRALSALQERGMHGAMQHTIFNLAREARERGELETALESLHIVYAEFIDRNMPVAAAEVLVELGDTVTELTQDVAYARDVCRRLAETVVVSEGVSPDVRKAMTYIRTRSENPASVSALREAFGKVRSFLLELKSSPMAAFVA
jgi:tetratricopeptide (TPR) repeat protein